MQMNPSPRVATGMVQSIGYRYITLGEAEDLLAARLYDAGPPNQLPAPMQFHSGDDDRREYRFYIHEALRTFNALANFYRQEFTFIIGDNETWVDATGVRALDGSSGLRPFTITDLQIINEIEYHLLEPLTRTRPLVWEGTLQFTLDDILNAIQQARDKVLSETGCTVSQSLIPAVPGRTFLDDRVMDIRRVCWIPERGTKFTPNVVLPSDLWATQSFHAGFPQRGNGTPLIYRRSTEPPVSFEVDIEPAVNGLYDILTTENYGALSLATNSIMPIPNDWYWVTKYGAMATLFGRESLAKDTLRADYCWNRYKQGTAAMQTAPAILGARINNVPVIVDSMSNGDFYFANWQGKKRGYPRYIFYSGLNLLGFAPIPNDVYSVTVECVRNMPLPELDSDYLQIGRDDISPVLDLAQHIAMEKVGGEEFTRTFPLMTNFLRHCKLYNSKLQAMSLWLEWLDGRQQEENIKVNPIFAPMANPATVEKPSGG